MKKFCVWFTNDDAYMIDAETRFEAVQIAIEVGNCNETLDYEVWEI